MYQTAKSQMTYWLFIGLFMLALAISALTIVAQTNMSAHSPLFETSTAVEPDAILACSGGASDNESGIC